MTTQTIRMMMDRYAPGAAALAALGAGLDAIATGKPLAAPLAARIAELLAALGGGDALEDVAPAEARGLAAELGHLVALDARLAARDTRTPGWAIAEADTLQAVGEFARNHAGLLARLAPKLAGLAELIAAPGAQFLDVGVGVAGTTIAVAEQWPALRVVGIDVHEPALALARANVASSPVRERIELRAQGIEQLADEARFALAWVPMPFIPAHALEAGCPRVHRALVPGGWAVYVYIDPTKIADAANAALWRLRQVMWGGPAMTTAAVERLLRDNGFAEAVAMPTPPGVPIGVVAGRRAP